MLAKVLCARRLTQPRKKRSPGHPITMADTSKTLSLTRSSVQSAHERIKKDIHRSPVLTSTTLSNLASTPQTPEALIGTPFEGQTPAKPKINFFFKCENYQRIGAFKIRGAFHALSRLSGEELSRGVVTHSSGARPLPHLTAQDCSVRLMWLSPPRQPCTSTCFRGPHIWHTRAHCHAHNFYALENCSNPRIWSKSSLQW